MNTPSSSHSISLAFNRYVQGVARTKIMESAYKIKFNNLDDSTVECFKSRVTAKLNEVNAEIILLGRVKAGDKKNAKKLIRLNNKAIAYMGALNVFSK